MMLDRQGSKPSQKRLCATLWTRTCI